MFTVNQVNNDQFCSSFPNFRLSVIRTNDSTTQAPTIVAVANNLAGRYIDVICPMRCS